MKCLFFTAILFIYGAFCDMCANFCTHLAEKNISQNKALNKKLLIFLSNFSSTNLTKWQLFERLVLHEFSEKGLKKLP